MLTLTAPLTNTYTVPAASAVTFTNHGGTSASGNTLTNVGCSTDWACGAVSTQTLASGDGFVEATPSETTTYRKFAAGCGRYLAVVPDLEFAFYLLPGGVLGVYESGEFRGYVGQYASSDRLRVGIEQGVVTYRKNGQLLYRSKTAPSYPLRVDTSFYSSGAMIADITMASGYGAAQVVRVPNYSSVTIAGAGVADVTWLVPRAWGRGVLDQLRSGQCTDWTCGAVSDSVLRSGDGYVEFSTYENDRYKIGGLGDAGPVTGLVNVAYGILLNPGGGVYIFERGVMMNGGAVGTYVLNDLFRVGIENGVVVYRQNGTVLYTSTVAPGYPLRFVGELYDNNATIHSARMRAAASLTSDGWDGMLGGIFALRIRDTLALAPDATIHLGPTTWTSSACTFTFNPGSLTALPAGGGPQEIAVGTQPACEWTGSSNQAWLTPLSTATMQGPGSFQFTVAPHTGDEGRSGALTIGGQTVSVTQRGACDYGISGGPGFPLGIAAGAGTLPRSRPQAPASGPPRATRRG